VFVFRFEGKRRGRPSSPSLRREKKGGRKSLSFAGGRKRLRLDAERAERRP